MAVHGGPKIATSGLVLSLDAANSKGFDSYENLMTSSQLGNTILNDAGAVTLTTDTSIINPFGAYDGVLKCVHTAQSGGYFRRGQNMSLTAGVTYTFSFYFKNGTVASPYGQTPIYIGILASTYTPTFEEPNQSLNTNINVGNEWYRQVFTFTPAYTQTYQVNFSQTVNQTPIGTYYLYGFQLETGSTASTYYPTTASTKTRGSTLIDLSGLGNTGTLTNGPTYSSANAGSIAFDGTNDYVNAGNLGSFYSQGTISYWMNSSAVENYRNPLSTHYLGYNVGIRFEQYSSPSPYGGFNVLVGNDAGTYVLYDYSPSAILTANIWYNVVLVWNTSTNNVVGYLNGTQKFNSTTHTYWATTLPSISIGSGFDASRYFKGKIANTQIYNRALTADEISQNFNATRGRYGV
jgi:hypothetical protein